MKTNPRTLWIATLLLLGGALLFVSPVAADSADFTANITNGAAPLSVQFTDTSDGTPVWWNWNFGDHTYASTKNPVHTYATPGNYTVTLRIISNGYTLTQTKTNYIHVTASGTPPVANFTANQTSGIMPLTVKFTDTSTGTGITTWAWDFNNDGTVDNTGQNPAYTYSAAGTYTVKLTVTSASGSDSEVKSSFIAVNNPLPAAPIANFTANPTSGIAPLLVQFTDTSTGTGISTWAWDFNNDGTVDNTTQSPSYTYATAGTYTVNLTVTNAGGNDSEVKSSFITVNTPPPAAPIANFTANQTSGNAPLLVQFTDTSTGTGITTWAWDFNNDGTVDNTTQSPSFTYATAGTYTVNLTVTNAGGSDSEVKSSFITVNNPLPDAPLANFTANPTSGNAPLLVQFTDTSTGTGISTWAWDFNNDGTVDNTTQSPSYTYATAGTYTVNLTVTNAGGSDSEVKSSFITVNTPPPAAPIANFTANPTSGIVPLLVQFTDTSTGTGISAWAWDFNNDGTVDNTTQSPSYTYATAGTYTVNLTVTNAGGSDSEVKNSYITVNNPLPDAPLANFTANPTSGIVPLLVQFTDTSTGTGISAWAWDFNNDGTVDNTTQSPSYTYATAGTYTVNLTVTNAGGSNTTQKPITVTQAVDVIFNGTVTVTEGATFSKVAYNNASSYSYTINQTTPLGALNAASVAGSFGYNISDKNFGTKGILMLDEIGGYWYNKTGSVTQTWICQVNGVSLDDYGAPTTDGFNIKSLKNGDQVDFYFGTKPVTPANATAVARMTVNTGGAGVDVIFDGTVDLAEGATFSKVAYNNASSYSYTINQTTPLGALNAASVAGSFGYSISDKNYATKGILLLDEIDGYWYNKTGSVTQTWICQVNGVTLDDYGAPTTDGFNIKSLNNGDQVNYYFGIKPVTPANATAVARMTVNTGGSGATDWTLSLSGARDQTVTETLFEQGLACPSSGHMVNWTDTDGNEWSGVPLWLLVAMVDDNPDSGPDHYNFNDALAAQGYSIKVTAGDGYYINFASADIARNNAYIVANTLNGQPLPILKPNSTKLCYPLQMIGPSVEAGQLVGNISSIELVGLPEPSTGWTLTLEGDVTDLITQQYFEQAIVCHHNVTYTDTSGRVWGGVPLWDLVGAVDDIETTSHWTFNDTRAAAGYTVRVIAPDMNATFTSQNVSHQNGFIVANTLNGTALEGTDAPLKLVGPATTSGKQRVGGLTTIRLEGLPSYPEGDWALNLAGAISDRITQPEFESWVACHNATYTDSTGSVYTGIPLYRLMGWVDDRTPHGSDGFNDGLANAGYKVIVTAGDGYSKELTSTQIGKNDGFIIANTLNGTALPTSGTHPPYPLRLVGSGLPDGSFSVGNVATIELTDFSEPVEIPTLHIVKYGFDRVTIINETTVDYPWMEANLPVIGNGTTIYRFEGITNNPADVWDANETYPGGYKIANAIKGSRVRDLCDLVGGMGTGDEIAFVASDGRDVKLGYSNIYTNPAVQARQGDAVIAWYADGQYVPQYADGMRLFFTPDDTIYGQWDMHESIPEKYWHYYWDGPTQYASCAGISNKYITTIRIYPLEQEWNLELDGKDIGGLNATISKNYFEDALACQFGANHKVTYTDSKGRVWEGMPLWFLAGYVDDADQHSNNAFNDTLAAAGYSILVTGADGSNTTISSQGIRNNNYIFANTLNGTHINETDENWPLRLVGANISGSSSVKAVQRIDLVRSGSSPALVVVPVSGTVAIDNTRQYEIRMTTFPAGLAGYNITVSITNATVGEIVGISFPAWAALNTSGTVPADSAWFSAVDLGKQVEPGATDVLLATLTLRGDVVGTSVIVPLITKMDADGGAVIAPAVVNGSLTVYRPLVADFEANMTTGTPPLAVHFTDLSAGDPGPSSWAWDFENDGTVDSTVQNPDHVYAAAGNYTVNLTVANTFNTNSSVKVQYISVRTYVEPFPGSTNPPADPDGDGLFEDVNGNGRLDFDDVVLFYQNMGWIAGNTTVGNAPYDYNGNGRIDYDDLVLLYNEVMGV